MKPVEGAQVLQTFIGHLGAVQEKAPELRQTGQFLHARTRHLRSGQVEGLKLSKGAQGLEIPVRQGGVAKVEVEELQSRKVSQAFSRDRGAAEAKSPEVGLGGKGRKPGVRQLRPFEVKGHQLLQLNRLLQALVADRRPREV